MMCQVQKGMLCCGAGAAAALCNLAEGSPENQAAICQAKALEKFPRLLQGGLTSSGLIIEVIRPVVSADCHLGVCWIKKACLIVADLMASCLYAPAVKIE